MLALQEEVRAGAARERVVMIDQSSFRKLEVAGPGACAGLNRLTMWNFEKCFRKRLALHHGGAHPGSVDVLVTGCEVSLWLAEQFASDLSLVFPALDIKTLSANKLLGLLGQLEHDLERLRDDFESRSGQSGGRAQRVGKNLPDSVESLVLASPQLSRHVRHRCWRHHARRHGASAAQRSASRGPT